MPEKVYNIDACGVGYICDSCKKGNMVANGQTLYIEHPKTHKYTHICTNCGKSKMMDIKYPQSVAYLKKLRQK